MKSIELKISEKVVRFKILSIIGSGRKNGHTSKIISLLKEDIEKLSIENNESILFETIFLSDYQIDHCRGCRACMDYGKDKCPIEDDLPLIKAKMNESDAIIFATPVYVGDVSSAMKALIDRMAYMCHRQELYEKSAIIIATTNATSLKRTIHTIGAATYSWGLKTVATKGFRTTTSNDPKEILQKRYQKDISKLSRKLYSAVKQKAYLEPSAIALASFKLQQKYRGNPEVSSEIDYNYWQKKGWTDSKKEYFIDVKVGLGKRIFSKILYSIFNRIAKLAQ